MSRISDDFSEVQKDVNTELFHEVEKMPVDGAFAKCIKEIGNYPVTLVKNALGELGMRLGAFGNSVDLDHPDVGTILGESSCTLLNETLKIYHFASTSKLTSILPQIRSIASKDFKTALKDVNDPSVGARWVRLLKTREARDARRGQKSAKAVDLSSFYDAYRPSPTNWGTVSDTMKHFARHNKFREQEIKKIQAKGDRYKDLGLSAMCAEITKSISSLKTRDNENFLGFQRVTMTDVAVGLARLHDFGYGDQDIDGRRRIKVPRKFAGFDFEKQPQSEKKSISENAFEVLTRKAKEYGGNYNFAMSSSNDMQEIFLDTTKAKRVISPAQTGPFDYTPRVYPLVELMDIASPEIAKFVDYLEALPEAGGKPIFDHYAVVIPTVTPTLRSSNSYGFSDKNGEFKSYNELTAAQKGFDKELVTNKIVYPVLLGERDGKCFFISYFY